MRQKVNLVVAQVCFDQLAQLANVRQVSCDDPVSLHENGCQIGAVLQKLKYFLEPLVLNDKERQTGSSWLH